MDRLHTTFVYFFMMFVFGFSSAALGPTILSLADLAGVSKSNRVFTMSWLFVLRAGCYALGALLSGMAVDRRWRGQRVLLGAMLVSATALLVVPLSRSLALTFAIFGVLGISNGAICNLPNVLLLQLYRGTAEDVSPYMQGLHAAYACGCTFALVIANAIVGEEKDATYISQMYSAVAASYVLGAGLIGAVDAGEDGTEAGESGTEDSETTMDLSGRVSPDYESKIIWIAGLFIYLYVGLEVSVGALLYTFLHEGNAGLGKEAATRVTMVYWGTFAAGRTLSIPAATRMTPLQIVDYSMVGVLVSCLVILCAPETENFLSLAVACFGFFGAPVYAGVLVLLENWIDMSGFVVGLIMVADTVGEATIPGLAGQIMATTHQEGFIWVLLGTCTLALCCYMALRFLAQQGQGTYSTSVKTITSGTGEFTGASIAGPREPDEKQPLVVAAE